MFLRSCPIINAGNTHTCQDSASVWMSNSVNSA